MNKLLNCITKKESSYVPIWFMRQAGRYLPEFMEIREKNTNFINLCLNPELVKDITLQPLERFNLDAAIIFSDILMVPFGLGQKIEFKKGFGPILENIDLEKILKVEEKNFIEKLSPVYKAISETKKLTGEKSLIGFVGAPWTILVYMLNKQSPKKDFNFNLIKKNPNLIKTLLKKIEKFICLHIKKQVDAGADIIQVFDSWAGLLSEKDFNEFCLEPNLKIVKFIKTLNVPAICFPRGIGKNYSIFSSTVKPDCINIDYEIDPNWANNNLNNVVIQGGMDPKVLLEDKKQIEKETKKYLEIFSKRPYIFNLGHGVLPQTKPETIEFIINLVKDNK